MAEGYLIPGEVAMGNCYKVFRDDRLYLVVKTQAMAEGLIAVIKDVHRDNCVPPSKWTIQLAFIEGIGF